MCVLVDGSVGKWSLAFVRNKKNDGEEKKILSCEKKLVRSSLFMSSCSDFFFFSQDVFVIFIIQRGQGKGLNWSDNPLEDVHMDPHSIHPIYLNVQSTFTTSFVRSLSYQTSPFFTPIPIIIYRVWRNGKAAMPPFLHARQ